MAGQLGLGIAGLLADLHRENGVELRLGETVGGLPADQGKATGVRLGTGEVLPAEVVVVAIGAVPETGWLTGSGLSLDGRDHGVVCDARCRAAEGIYAVGDVAHWYHAGLGVPLRLENRTNAVEQATAAAGNILGENQPYIPIPYFWTDQFTTKIQMYGRPVLDGEVTLVEGSVEDRRFVVQYRHQGQVTGVLGWNMPKQARLHRQALLAGSRPESAGALA
jgi:NADPH-dependent 2,4-dienoyl-CoA reductase/sulfur reductase-like enzyme